MPTSDVETFRPGSVVVVPFPFSDRLAEKRRPAVIVSGGVVARAGYVWIAMITSARQERLPGDLPIEDFAAAGLTVASVVRPLKITCIEPNRILRRVGTLPPASAARVFASIHGMTGEG